MGLAGGAGTNSQALQAWGDSARKVLRTSEHVQGIRGQWRRVTVEELQEKERNKKMKRDKRKEQKKGEPEVEEGEEEDGGEQRERG